MLVKVDLFELTCSGEVTCIDITIVQGFMRVQNLIVEQIQFHAYMVIPRAFHSLYGK
jgi:hypothetical protein